MLDKARNITDRFFSHFLFIFISSIFCLTIAYLVYMLFLLFLKDSSILFMVILGIFYFIPNVSCTMFFLNKWNNNSNFIFMGLFSKNRQLIPFDRQYFKFMIDVITLLSTFIILIAKPFDYLNDFNNPINSLLLAVYPVKLGFMIWEYLNPLNKEKNKYYPTRKFK